MTEIFVEDVDEFLEHHGVKGMKWGERRAARKESNAELKTIKSKNARAEKLAKKAPGFRREVKATLKGKGISGDKTVRFESTPKYGRHTGRLLGNFKNSKKEKVSIDFANAVMAKAAKKQDRRTKAKIGAQFVAAVMIGSYLGKRAMRR